MFFSYSGGPPAATDLTTFCTDVGGYYSSHLAASASGTQILTLITAEDLQSASANVGQAVVNIPGTNAGAQLTAGVATCMNHRIARKYRGGKPKTFMPIGTTNDVGSGNTWSASYITGFGAVFAAFIAEILTFSSASFVPTDHVNVSYYSGFTSVQNPLTKRWRNVPTLRGTPIVDTITSSYVAEKFGSQRRRLNL